MNYAIIVAGGTGNRMGSEIPKQFLLLDGLPVMMHTINAFHKCRSAPRIVVVINPALRDQWTAHCEMHGFQLPHTVADGGKSRFESVKNGLGVIKSMGIDLSKTLVAVHDAARPLISPTLIDNVYRQAALTGAAAPAIPSTNAIRIKSGNGLKNNTFRREHVYLMQTPQAFNTTILCDAYEQSEDNSFSDDASVVEKKGYPITLVDGDTRNIKITFPEDLHIAETLLGTMHLGRASNDAQ